MSIHCILNPINNHEITSQVSRCGIQLMMNNSITIREPDIIIFFKGELYNHNILCYLLKLDIKIQPENIIIFLYKKYGIEYTLSILDGVFTFIIFDYSYNCDVSKLYIIRDLFGIIPLYCLTNKQMTIFSDSIVDINVHKDTIQLSQQIVNPGSYTLYELGSKVSAEWKISSNIVNRPYFVLPNSLIKYDTEYKIDTKLSKCLKDVIIKISNLSKIKTDIIVEKMLASINIENSYEIDIFDEESQSIIKFSTLHFFSFPNDISMFEYDIVVREQLYSTNFQYTNNSPKYPFFDKDFISLYFSIPLQIRYKYHSLLFDFLQ